MYVHFDALPRRVLRSGEKRHMLTFVRRAIRVLAEDGTPLQWQIGWR